MVIRDDCRTKTKIGCWINIQIRLYYHHYYYYKRNALALVDLLYRHHTKGANYTQWPKVHWVNSPVLHQLSNCWFSVSCHSKQSKIKIKTVQQIKSRIWEMKGGKYAKTLTKIQVRGIFRIRDIRRNVFTTVIEICMETPCWYPSGWTPTQRKETNRNITVTEFWYKG